MEKPSRVRIEGVHSHSRTGEVDHNHWEVLCFYVKPNHSVDRLYSASSLLFDVWMFWTIPCQSKLIVSYLLAQPRSTYPAVVLAKDLRWMHGFPEISRIGWNEYLCFPIGLSTYLLETPKRSRII